MVAAGVAKCVSVAATPAVDPYTSKSMIDGEVAPMIDWWVFFATNNRWMIVMASSACHIRGSYNWEHLKSRSTAFQLVAEPALAGAMGEWPHVCGHLAMRGERGEDLTNLRGELDSLHDSLWVPGDCCSAVASSSAWESMFFWGHPRFLGKPANISGVPEINQGFSLWYISWLSLHWKHLADVDDF